MGSGPSSSIRRLWVGGAVGAAVIAAATVAGLLAARASVEGDTPAERIASIGRIAADRPHGAAKALADTVQRDPDPAVRAVAVTALMGFPSADSREAIGKALAQPDGRVRRAAAAALGRYGDSAAVDTLIQLIEGDTDVGARLGALEGLGGCDDPRAIVTLLTIAETDADMDMKTQAMRALLGRLGARLGKAHAPQDPRIWRDLVQRLKRSRPVRDAFAALSLPLIMRPEDEIGVRHHKDRPTTPGPAPPSE